MNPIDFDHLARQTMNDAELQRELLRIFESQIEGKLAELQAPNADIKQVAHSIKGSARAIGAFDLANAAEAMEMQDCFDVVCGDKLIRLVKDTRQAIGLFLSGS